MKKLLEFLVKNIIGSEDFTIEEEVNGDQSLLTIKTDPKYMGLIIGKGGKTIKNLRNILKIKAVLENKQVNINASEK